MSYRLNGFVSREKDDNKNHKNLFSFAKTSEINIHIENKFNFFKTIKMTRRLDNFLYHILKSFKQLPGSLFLKQIENDFNVDFHFSLFV